MRNIAPRRRRRIDAVLAETKTATASGDIQLVAERGLIAPESLTFDEIRQMCFIVSVHFACDQDSALASNQIA